MTQQQQPLTLCTQDSGGVVAGSTGSNSICSKDFRERTLRSLKLSLGKLWRRKSVTITEYDPTYKVAYLGNVLTGWAKGEGCVEKPLSTLWKNYTGSSKPDVQMKVTVTQAGLKAVTKEHGLTEYWSHRITYCAAPASFPRIFCWVYRHEGRKLKQELRCHAVLCSKEAVARRMASQLKTKLAQSLSEFKRDKVCRQNARLSLANSVYDNPSLPRRKILLSTGSHNYRPPLERSKSAPKLMVIEECVEECEEENSDCQRDHTNRLYKDSMVLNRLDEAVGEETYQENSIESEEAFLKYSRSEKEASSREYFRLQSNGDIMDKDKYEELNGAASFVSGDVDSDNKEARGSLMSMLDSHRDSVFDEGTSGEKCGRSLLRFRGSGERRVSWKCETRDNKEDGINWNRFNHQTERLLVIGSCKDGDVRRRSPLTERVGEKQQCSNSQQECESDEGSNSLQSISSSASSTSDGSSRVLESVAPCLKITKPFTPYVYEDTDIQTPEDEVEVDLHPTGGPLKRRHPVNVEVDRLSAQLRRSATFPPPSALGCVNGGEVSELDSLSEEEDAMETAGEHDEDLQEEEEEDNVSDESGYAELMDVGVKELGERLTSGVKKEKDVPNHQLMKTVIRSNSRSSQCLQV